MASADAEMQRLTQCNPGERLADIRRGTPQVISEQLVGGTRPGCGPAGFVPGGWYATGNETERILPYPEGKEKVQKQYWNGALYQDQQVIDEQERLVGWEYDPRRVVSEHVTGQYNQWLQAVKSTYTVEKVVEQPITIIKEREKEVKKPEIIERIIQVPKTEIRELTRVQPPEVIHQEQIVEVPQVAIEERVLHKPKHVVQERLIEVPKFEFVERIEYQDFVEYREVPVDKIVEVPEIEYRVREVEKYVPQTFVEEYYIDNYVEVPVTQVQEVERKEYVPMPSPPCDCDQLMMEIAESKAARMRAEAEVAELRREIATLKAGMAVKSTTVVSTPPTPVVMTPPASVRSVQVVQAPPQVVQAVQYVPQVAVQRAVQVQQPVVVKQAVQVQQVQQPVAVQQVFVPAPPVPTPPGSVSVVARPATPMASERAVVNCAVTPPSPPATSPSVVRVQPVMTRAASATAVAPPMLVNRDVLTSYATYEPATPRAVATSQTMLVPSEPLGPASFSSVIPLSASVANVPATIVSTAPSAARGISVASGPQTGLFEALDRNGDGVITRAEFEQAAIRSVPTPGSTRSIAPSPATPMPSAILPPGSQVVASGAIVAAGTPPGSVGGACSSMQYVGTPPGSVGGACSSMQYVGSTRLGDAPQ